MFNQMFIQSLRSGIKNNYILNKFTFWLTECHATFFHSRPKCLDLKHIKEQLIIILNTNYNSYPFHIKQ